MFCISKKNFHLNLYYKKKYEFKFYTRQSKSKSKSNQIKTKYISKIFDSEVGNIIFVLVSPDSVFNCFQWHCNHFRQCN